MERQEPIHYSAEQEKINKLRQEMAQKATELQNAQQEFLRVFGTLDSNNPEISNLEEAEEREENMRQIQRSLADIRGTVETLSTYNDQMMTFLALAPPEAFKKAG